LTCIALRSDLVDESDETAAGRGGLAGGCASSRAPPSRTYGHVPADEAELDYAGLLERN